MIFFDIDGTLLDHETAEKQAAIQFANNLNITRTSDEAFVALWHEAAERYMDQYLDGQITFEEQRHHRLQEALGSVLTISDAKKLFSHYVSVYEEAWRLYDDVLPCLKRLNQNLGIITNGNRHQQRLKLQKTGIDEYFSIIVTSEEVGYPKPSIEIFQHACSISGSEPRHCLYIGDRLITDAVGAIDAGWQGTWLNRTKSQADIRPDVRVIETLFEFIHD